MGALHFEFDKLKKKSKSMHSPRRGLLEVDMECVLFTQKLHFQN